MFLSFTVVIIRISIRFDSIVVWHFAGLFPLYTIMSQGFYELRIDLEDWNNETRHATYTRFSIDPDNFYFLRLKGYSGNAGTSAEYFNVMNRRHWYLIVYMFLYYDSGLLQIWKTTIMSRTEVLWKRCTYQFKSIVT